MGVSSGKNSYACDFKGKHGKLCIVGKVNKCRFPEKIWIASFSIPQKNRKQPQKWQCVIQPAVGYQIQVHWQNNCTESVYHDGSIIKHFLYSDCLFFINLSSSAKNTQCMFHWRSPQVKYCIFQKSLTHFGFTTSTECLGQILQKLAEFWYPINSVIWLNDAWSFLQSLLPFSFAEWKKLAIHNFFRSLNLLTFPCWQCIVSHVFL